MGLLISTPFRLAIALFISAVLVSGCSGSSPGDSQSPDEMTPDEMTPDEMTPGEMTPGEMTPGETDGGTTDGTNVTADDGATGVPDPGTPDPVTPDPVTPDPVTPDPVTPDPVTPDPVTPDPVTPDLTRVNFDITVPVYASDALQVRLVWGNKNLTGKWVTDELWSISDDFPTNTENPLVVTFYDRNGDITLGRVESIFKTGTNPSESFQITADQFDTHRWDGDGDGISNLDELTLGTNPLGDDPVEPVQASLELVADKTFRISWQPSAGVQSYRILENPDGVSGFSSISADLDATTLSFDHRVALYSRVNARYIVQACNTLGCVDSDEQIVSGSLQSAIGYFKASNTEASDNFGDAVSLSADGNTLAIGAPGEDSATTRINRDESSNSSPNSGAVYIFEYINVTGQGTWQQQAYVKASNTDSNDNFGGAVSLSADGNTLAVGASREDSATAGINGNQNDDTADDAGAVYMFTRSAGSWQQQAYLKASNAGYRHWFGAAVSLSADGNTLAVGASSESGGSTGVNGDQENQTAPWSGAVYIFVRFNENWQQQAYLKASNTDTGDAFGTSISLSRDGNTLAIGADGDRGGAVYVFVRNNDTWRQQAYVKASNTGTDDYFGHSVGLSGDGNTLAVGAIWEDSNAVGVNGNQNDNSSRSAGAVYVYSRINENWQQQAYLKASNPNDYNMFGYSVSLSTNGDALAIGSFRESSAATGINGNQYDNSTDSAGAAYVFIRDNGNWQQRAYLKGSNSFTGYFGRALSMSAAGDTLAVGSPSEDGAAIGINGDQNDHSAANAGAVYLY